MALLKKFMFFLFLNHTVKYILNLLDTRKNTIGKFILGSAKVNMNHNYAVIGSIPQFCISLKEFIEK